MNPDESQAEDYDKPVAYDANGQPLYSHPAETPPQIPLQVVHTARPVDIEKPFISIATQAKHDEAKRLYPELNLSGSEYVITMVRRHPIGLFGPLAIGVMLIALSLSALLNYDIIAEFFRLTDAAASVSAVVLPITLFILLVCLGVYIAYFVYTNNKFYLTNESVIQEIQMGLFHRREQTISLGSVEDASYVQNGILQEILGYGEIRLSTIGNENTYTFPYAGHPKERIAALNDAVEAFKNGRPVDTTVI